MVHILLLALIKYTYEPPMRLLFIAFIGILKLSKSCITFIIVRAMNTITFSFTKRKKFSQLPDILFVILELFLAIKPVTKSKWEIYHIVSQPTISSNKIYKVMSFKKVKWNYEKI